MLDWPVVADFRLLQFAGMRFQSIRERADIGLDGKVTRIEVADTTLDLVIYMHENGWVCMVSQ